MRTLSSTVGTHEEAETVSRRLQAIGVASDRINFRDLSANADGFQLATPDPELSAESQDGSGGRGIFISVKVMPEQVSSATAILKAATAPPSNLRRPAAAIEPDQAATDVEQVANKVPPRGADGAGLDRARLRASAPPGGSIGSPDNPGDSRNRRLQGQTRVRSRGVAGVLAIIALTLAVAFCIGYVLGTVT